jgi:hypothetical protein
VKPELVFIPGGLSPVRGRVAPCAPAPVYTKPMLALRNQPSCSVLCFDGCRLGLSEGAWGFNPTNKSEGAWGFNPGPSLRGRHRGLYMELKRSMLRVVGSGSGHQRMLKIRLLSFRRERGASTPRIRNLESIGL